MLEITYRVVQNGKFVGYVVASNNILAEYLALKMFGANCMVAKLLV
jgi:hypothetical protein